MKRLAILVIAAMFVISGTAFAAVRQMTNDELAGVKAGDWVVKNTLELEDMSQMSVYAISNANLVDSAAAVQSNIGTLTGVALDVKNSNFAKIENWRAADACAFDLDVTSNHTSTTIENTTSDSVDSTSRGLLGLFAENTPGSSGDTSNGSTIEECDLTINIATSGRDAKATRNKLELEATSQQYIQAISNLNAVGSGVAVQSNIVSGVEMSGSLTNSNVACVKSGL